MHRVELAPLSTRGDIVKLSTAHEPGVAVRHAGAGMPWITIHPQRDGVGYGLTICAQDGATLLTIDQDGNVHYPKENQ